MIEDNTITIRAVINAPVDKVWRLYTGPEHIVKWNTASDDWHSPRAENNLEIGGRFNIRMEAKDGSAGFDFSGKYGQVKTNEIIAYTMDDGRKVDVRFSDKDGKTEVVLTFEAESTNPIEFQRQGWQSILDNFKRFVEKR